MSILIKGMEIPKNCFECPFAMSHFTTLYTQRSFSADYSCVITHKALTSTKRNRFCPLVEIPMHGRLIDADEAIGHLFIGEQCLYSWDEIEKAIDATETIIDAEE